MAPLQCCALPRANSWWCGGPRRVPPLWWGNSLSGRGRYPPIELRRDWRVPPCGGRRLPFGGRIMLRADAFERASAWSSVRARRFMEHARDGRSRRANAGGRAPPARALELPWAGGRLPLAGGQQGVGPGGPGSGNGNRPLCYTSAQPPTPPLCAPDQGGLYIYICTYRCTYSTYIR